MDTRFTSRNTPKYLARAQPEETSSRRAPRSKRGDMVDPCSSGQYFVEADMLIGFHAGPVSVTLWDPKTKQMYSPTCRPSCFVCKILMGVIKIATRLYHVHRGRAYVR